MLCSNEGMIIFVVCALLLLVLWCVIEYQRRIGDDRRLPPGPRPWPIVGDLLQLDAKAPHVALARLAGKYGPIFGLQLGQVYTVVLADAELIREALKQDALTGRAPLHVTHGIMGGYGLICAEGDLWRDQRRLSIGWLKTLGMLKHDHPARSRLLSLITAGACESVHDILQVAAIDPHHSLLHTMGNIMNQLVFGRQYSRTDGTWLYLQHLQQEGVRHIGVSGAVNFLPWLRHLPQQRRVIAFLLGGKAKTHAIYDRLVDEVQQLDSGDSPATNIIALFLRERRARQLANDQDRLALCSDQQLRHLLADLFGAGLDTTLTTLRWFLLYVARDPHVQQRIRGEMAATLITADQPPSYDDLDRLPYLRAALAETQRIRPVVPLGIPHGVNGRSPVQLAGYRIPAGSMVIPLQWAVHMDAANWPDPEQFRPERFLNPASGQFIGRTAAFIPFQTGQRRCPGEELARMMLFVYAARILWACELRIAGDDGRAAVDMQGECGITLTPCSHEIRFIGRRADAGGLREQQEQQPQH